MRKGLLSRSDHLNLAVGFNPRVWWKDNRVASATAEIVAAGSIAADAARSFSTDVPWVETHG